MTTIPTTVFSAAAQYANGLEDRHNDKGLAILIRVKPEGLSLQANWSPEERRTDLVQWHDIEHRQYDAVRERLEKLVAEI